MHSSTHQNSETYSAGFTLVELSVVLVIIGLLVGGILTGMSMQRQSAINSTMVDVQRYITATQNFSTKYNALPGDMANATSYWGVAGGNTSDNYTITCYGTTGTGTHTCNGNGDAHIAALPSTTNVTETLLYWQHLANAQLIQGTYTGVGASSGAGNVPGVNAPAGKLSNTGFGIQYLGVLSGNASYFDGSYGHAFTFGAPLANNAPSTAIITGPEAQAFDTKFDDGLPATGNVVTFKPSVLASCASSSASTATYLINTTGPKCSLVFISGF